MTQLVEELGVIADRLDVLTQDAPESAERRVAQVASAVRKIAETLHEEELATEASRANTAGTCSILVVDDDPVIRETLKAYLCQYGSVEFFENGEDAIAYMQMNVLNDPADVIVLDIKLPGIDGHEVLKRIRALTAVHGNRFQPHVLMTSSLDAKEHVVNALRLGASGYLVKPITPEGLARQMSAIGFEPISRSA